MLRKLREPTRFIVFSVLAFFILAGAELWSAARSKLETRFIVDPSEIVSFDAIPRDPLFFVGVGVGGLAKQKQHGGSIGEQLVKVRPISFAPDKIKIGLWAKGPCHVHLPPIRRRPDKIFRAATSRCDMKLFCRDAATVRQRDPNGILFIGRERSEISAFETDVRGDSINDSTSLFSNLFIYLNRIVSTDESAGCGSGRQSRRNYPISPFTPFVAGIVSAWLCYRFAQDDTRLLSGFLGTLLFAVFCASLIIYFNEKFL